MIGPTHFFFAIALAHLLKYPKLPAAIGGIIPDLDVLMQGEFPFNHRGFVHTFAFLMLSMAVLLLFSKQLGLTYEMVFGFGTGFLSHLFIDTINPTGIAWLYPLTSQFFSLRITTYTNVAVNLAIIGFSIAVIPLANKLGMVET